MALNTDKLIPVTNPAFGVVKSGGNNLSLDQFTNAVTAMQNVVTCISSAMDAYAKIQISHDQVRITQA